VATDFAENFPGKTYLVNPEGGILGGSTVSCVLYLLLRKGVD
jgi:hypothetical protein